MTVSGCDPKKQLYRSENLGMKMSFGAPENNQQKSNGVSRRTLVKTAAWTVPVIAFAAPVPAMAASVCTPTTNLDGLNPNPNKVITSIPFYPGTATASLAYASSGQGGDSTPGGTGTVAATSTNPSWNYIEIEMVSKLNQGDWVTVTLTFPQGPVEDLRFTIHDIDKVRSGHDNVAWVDHVVITGTTSFSYVAGNNIDGSGAPGDPFRPDEWGDNPIDSGLNRVSVTFNGPVTQVVITYLAGENGSSGNQHIGLGNLSFNACPTPGGPQARSLSSSSESLIPLALPAESTGFIASDGSADL